MTADTVGGVWTYAVELAGSLGARGHEVALATMGGPLSAEQRRAAGRVPNLELFESGYALEWMDDPWPDVERAGEWLLELEGRARPDVVHLNGYAHGALEWRAPALVVAHSCVLSWWEAVKGEPAPARWGRYRTEVGRGLRAARLVVAPSRWMLARVEALYPGAARGRVIPNGRDAAAFPPSRKAAYVFAAGRVWDEAKNLAALARVAPELPWPVFVAGDAARPGGGGVILGGVRTLGRLGAQEVASWLAGASIYVLPARYEPFGLSVLEAALAGCALVLGDLPSLRENWEGAARFVDPEDDGALAGAIRRLAEDAGERALLAERARWRALELTPGLMAARYLVAYADAAGTGRAGAALAAAAPAEEGSTCAS